MAAVFGSLRRRSSHQFFGSGLRKLRRRSSHHFCGSCFPEAGQTQLSPICWQLSSGGFAGAAFTNHLAAVFRRLRWPSSHQLFVSCSRSLRKRHFGAAVFRRLRGRGAHQFFVQLFCRRLRRLSTFFWQLCCGGCASAAFTNFLAAVFRRLRRRTSHQFFGSCFPEAAQAQLSPFFLAAAFRGYTVAALTNFLAAVLSEAAQAQHFFLAAVFWRLRKRSSHQFLGCCFPEAA